MKKEYGDFVNLFDSLKLNCGHKERKMGAIFAHAFEYFDRSWWSRITADLTKEQMI